MVGLADLIKNGWEKDYCVSINIPNLSTDKISGTRWTLPAHDGDQPVNTKAVIDLRGETAYYIHPAHYHKSRTYESNSDATALKQNEVSLSLISHMRMSPPKPPSFAPELRRSTRAPTI